MSRAELRELWEGRVADFRASGQTAQAWCSERGISLHTLRYWLRKVGNDNQSGSTEPAKWLSVEITGEQTHQPVVSGGGMVVCVGDARVEVYPGCNLVLLREVVQTLAMLC